MTSLLTCLTLFHGRDICRVEEAVEEVEEVLVTVMVGGDPLLQEVFYLDLKSLDIVMVRGGGAGYNSGKDVGIV